MPEIDVTPYDPNWPELYLQLRNRIIAALPDVVVKHIGSTAVPGLASRPVIDVMVGLRHWPPSEEDMAALASVGLLYHPVVSQPEWLFFRAPALQEYQVYVVRYSSPVWDRPLVFRDYLRSHSDRAEAFGQLKLRAAGTDEARRSYAAAKEAFVAETFDQAWAWNGKRLKTEATEIMKRLGLPDCMQEHGIASVVGSCRTGLLVRRDMDIHVLAQSSDLYLAINPALSRFLDRADVREVHIRDNREDSGLILGLHGYEGLSGEWDIDIMVTHRMERTRFAIDERIVRGLTDEQRNAIFRIKGDYYRHGRLGSGVSMRIYRAVLDGGVRTVEEFRRRDQAVR